MWAQQRNNFLIFGAPGALLLVTVANRSMDKRIDLSASLNALLLKNIDQKLFALNVYKNAITVFSVLFTKLFVAVDKLSSVYR